MIKSSKSGFTLAEVLTTLMVIGVVAAMTIPTLLNSTENQQLKVATKKAASVLGQAVQLIVAREVDCAAQDKASDVASASKALTSCMTNALSGTRTADNEITTTDGMIYRFYAPEFNGDIYESCGKNIFTAGTEGLKGAGNCAVVVDVNGKKGTSPLTDLSAKFSETSGFSENPQTGTDKVAFSLNSAGVRPMAFQGEGENNYAYEYMNGEVSDSIFNTKLCCAKIPDPDDATKKVSNKDGDLCKAQPVQLESCGSDYEECKGQK